MWFRPVSSTVQFKGIFSENFPTALPEGNSPFCVQRLLSVSVQINTLGTISYEENSFPSAQGTEILVYGGLPIALGPLG